MENSIVKKFQNLQVLNSYDYIGMDELVQDLTLALEDAARPQRGKGGSNGSAVPGCSASTSKKSSKKRRTRKRRPSISNGHMSEASESSLEDVLLKDYIDSMAQQSDSDELLGAAAKHLASFSLPNYPLSFAESDSVNENFSPMRPHRRRRRCFKRMAVDPQAEEKPLAKDGRVTRRSGNTDSGDSHMDMDGLLTVHGASGSVQEVKPGKRKRAVKDKSFDLDTGPNDQSNGGGIDSTTTEQSSSSISSSEGEGLFTNDEAREGDDEQSDFFHEPGPSCGIPGILPWWESERLHSQEQQERDPTFEAILTGSFEHMSAQAKRNFKNRLKMLNKRGREIRFGRRRFKDRTPGYTLSRFLQERQQWTDTSKILSPRPTLGNGSTPSSDTKRRRRTPPNSSNEGEFVGESAEPIPETNVGNRMLQNMGWIPGSGLGADGSGITAPILACKRPTRLGLGGGQHTNL